MRIITKQLKQFHELVVERKVVLTNKYAMASSLASRNVSNEGKNRSLCLNVQQRGQTLSLCYACRCTRTQFSVWWLIPRIYNPVIKSLSNTPHRWQRQPHALRFLTLMAWRSSERPQNVPGLLTPATNHNGNYCLWSRAYWSLLARLLYLSSYLQGRDSSWICWHTYRKKSSNYCTAGWQQAVRVCVRARARVRVFDTEGTASPPKKNFFQPHPLSLSLKCNEVGMGIYIGTPCLSTGLITVKRLEVSF